ncbi:FecR family protein [Chitinophaga caseinilytica]|uniref:FecR domain-containing protein n=1 Tax=Chitinophaga caseinilytica TaxID=2267521 RepID=A0ABZ2YX08_9BACT
MTNQVDSPHIHRYLDRLCTPMEQARVEAFLQLPEGRELLNAVLEARMAADMEESASAVVPAETRAQWKAKLAERMFGDGSAPAKVVPMRKWFKAAMWAAVIGGAGWMGARMLKHAQREPAMVMASKQTANGRRAVVRLTDGSVVHLGAGSSLRYPESFSGDAREVFLDGEAFFEIAEKPGQPFMVHSGEVRTTVLGTSFRVSAFNGRQALVAVATGKVRVDHVKDGVPQELAVLTPGEELNWEQTGGKFHVAEVKATDVEAWKGGRLVFHSKPLLEIAKELERWYGVEIAIGKESISDQKITVTLSGAAPLDKTMQLLAAGGGFSYITQGGKVTIH